MAEHEQTQDQMTSQIEKFVELYNSNDNDGLARLFADGVTYTQHGTPMAATGIDELLGGLAFISESFPDRRYTEVRRVLPSNDAITAEVVWEGTAVADVEGLATKGQQVKFEACAIFTFAGGLITAWDVYG